ncbi:MAG: winged helix-turn-helix transcriptional regulator, partial [Chloroflexota bacterium]|nr:winged helix-turn-helix transcriptional regulator [Chloroflexota bacterium]
MAASFSESVPEPAIPPDTPQKAGQASGLFELQARLCKMLTDPKRLQILTFLEHGPSSVSAIAGKLGA